jgi:phosphorylcholine metabolism protein LicD
MTKERAAHSLLEYKVVMEAIGQPFMLDGGTLLGAYRDQDFCEDDWNDIDTTIWHQEPGVIADMTRWLTALGFIVHHHWPKKEKTTEQISFKREKIKIDVMLKERKGDCAWWTVYGGERGITYKSLPAHHYDNPASVQFLGQQFLIPGDTENYLTARYGDWRTPVHRRDYSYLTSDRCIKNSYEEI